MDPISVRNGAPRLGIKSGPTTGPISIQNMAPIFGTKCCPKLAQFRSKTGRPHSRDQKWSNNGCHFDPKQIPILGPILEPFSGFFRWPSSRTYFGTFFEFWAYCGTQNWPSSRTHFGAMCAPILRPKISLLPGPILEHILGLF